MAVLHCQGKEVVVGSTLRQELASFTRNCVPAHSSFHRENWSHTGMGTYPCRAKHVVQAMLITMWA